MIGDLDISGIFLPNLLVQMGITYVLFGLVHGLLQRLDFIRPVRPRVTRTGFGAGKGSPALGQARKYSPTSATTCCNNAFGAPVTRGV